MRQKELKKGSLVEYISNANVATNKSDNNAYQCCYICTITSTSMTIATVSATAVLLLLVVAKTSYIPGFLRSANISEKINKKALQTTWMTFYLPRQQH